VRYDAIRDLYVITSGQQRWQAARVAGLKTVPCTFQAGEEMVETWERWATEQLARPDLGPLSTARIYRLLMECKDWTGKNLAAALGLHPSKVSRTLALLKLPEAEQARVAAGQCSVKAAVRATVKPQRSRHPNASHTVTITTTAGSVAITPRDGQTVETVLYLALQQTHTQRARAA
jgi:ParB family chromosome partitioning protein